MYAMAERLKIIVLMVSCLAVKLYAVQGPAAATRRRAPGACNVMQIRLVHIRPVRGVQCCLFTNAGQVSSRLFSCLSAVGFVLYDDELHARSLTVVRQYR